MLCENCHTRCADFIRGIAVCCDAVTADKASLHPAVFHDQTRHVVANQRHINAAAAQLIRSQPRTLQQRARLVGKDVELVAAFLAQKQRAERCAVAGRC